MINTVFVVFIFSNCAHPAFQW